jgi:hypothetical protein
LFFSAAQNKQKLAAISFWDVLKKQENLNLPNSIIFALQNARIQEKHNKRIPQRVKPPL